jgi:uncharacterized protein (DUF885 family)
MPDSASEFDALGGEFYSVWFRYRPDLALTVGVQDHAYRLPAQDDDELEALGSWLESLLLGLDEVDCQALDADRRLDYALMCGSARLEHRELRDWDWRRRDPLRFLPFEEVHRLALDSTEGFGDWLARLLSQIPEYLRHAQGQLKAAAGSLAPTMVRAAVREAEEGRCYLRELIRGPGLRGYREERGDLESIAELACDALAQFREFLAVEVAPKAAGPLGCGARHLALRMAELHFLDVDEGGATTTLARALAGVEDAIQGYPGQPRSKAPSHAPEGREVAGAMDVSEYQARCDDTRARLELTGLVTLPEEPLHIAIRPRCPGMEQGDAFYVAQREGAGTLYLPLGGGIHAGRETQSSWSACLPWGWGGAHLMAFAGRAKAMRMPRRLANARSLTHAWDLYLHRQLSLRPGADQADRLSSLLRQRERLVYAQLDLDLHRGRVDVDGALARLAALGQDGSVADARLARISRAPGDALAGALGWLLLEAARTEQEIAEGESFSPRAFHDRLLSQGAVPLPLVLRSVFGEALWRSSYERAFGS